LRSAYFRAHKARIVSIFDGAHIGAQVRFNSEGEPVEYEACPDADVFDWDDARLKAVENFQKKPFTLFVKKAISSDFTEDVEIKKTLVNVRRVQERLIRIDKKGASLLQAVSLREVRPTISARNSYEQRLNKWLIPVLFSLLCLVPMFAATLVSLWVNSHRGWWLLLLGAAEVAIMGAAAVALLFGGKRWQLAFAIILIWCTVAAFIVGFHYRNRNPGLLLEFSAGIAISGLMAVAVLLLAIWIAFSLEFRGQGTSPEALLLIDMLSLIAIAMEWEGADEKRHQLIDRLEGAATRAERIFLYAARHNGERFRKWGKDRGRRIAAVIRKHEERVLEVSAEQRSLVTASLMNGLIYLIRRDWGSLLVVEPESVKSILRRYAPRVGLAILLVALAFLLPYLFPHVIKDSLSFEVTLLITAGFTLIGPDAREAADTVRSSISPGK
jgi:hypothetical protein